MVLEIVCIFVWGHLGLWTDVETQEVGNLWGFPSIVRECENTWMVQKPHHPALSKSNSQQHPVSLVGESVCSGGKKEAVDVSPT